MEQSVLLAVLTLPILFSCLGAWEVWRGSTMRAEYERVASEQLERVATLQDLQQHDAGASVRLPDGRRFVPVADAIARSERLRNVAETDLLVARLREAAAWLTLLAGSVTGGGGVAGLLLVSWSVRRGARSRPELVAAFGRVSRFLPVALSTQVAGAALALLGAVTFEASGLWFVSAPDDRTVLLAMLGLVCACLALWGGVTTLRNLRRALHAFVPAPLPLPAIPVKDVQAPGLFALLRELALERGTTLPDVVAVGVEKSFFVSAFPMLLQGGAGIGRVITCGRTLHLPLPEMATLNIEELRTVLAHELAHFSGEDTDYSMQFQPLYVGLGQGADVMSLRRTDWGGTLVDRLLERAVHPHTVLAVHAFERFDHVVAHWSRLRELEADRAAVASGSAEALASSLLRLGLVAEVLRAELSRIAEHPDAAPPDLAATLVARMGAEGVGDPAAHLGDQAPHPTDAHPPARQRIEAADVLVDAALMARAARPVADVEFAAVRALFADWDDLSRGITEGVRDRALRHWQEHRDHLRHAAGMVGPEVTLLHASLLRPVVSLALLGSFCLILSIGCVLAALYGGAQDREAWRLLAALAAVGAVGLGFVALWSVRLWRGRGAPYLVLTAEGVRSPGFTGMVRWVDMRAIGVSALQSPTTSFLLRPEAVLPRRTGLIRRLRIDTKQHAVQFMGMLPQGLRAGAFQDLLRRYAHAAHARNSLEGENRAQEPMLRTEE